MKTESEGIGVSTAKHGSGGGGGEGNPSFKDCQRFGPKKVSGKTIPIRDCTREE